MKKVANSSKKGILIKGNNADSCYNVELTYVSSEKRRPMKARLFFISALIVFIIIGVSLPQVYAQENITVAGGDVPPDQQQMEPAEGSLLPLPVTQKVEYTLPYPGILPDHPLYFLKRLRDTILEKLISDPVRKAEFYILQGDKRLQMGLTLIEEGKATLGESTISKGEKYIEQAVTQLSSHKGSGGVVAPYVVEKLEKSIAKHQEVITDLIEKVTDTEKAGLQGSMELIKQMSTLIQSLK